MIEFSIPLYVYVSKRKKFNLNLNDYRNTHYQELSKAKNSVETLVLLRLRGSPDISTPAKLTVTLWKEGKRRRDLSNVCSIADKFVCDAMVKSGVIKDDSCDEIVRVEYIYGGIDRNNPRIDIKLESVK